MKAPLAAVPSERSPLSGCNAEWEGRSPLESDLSAGAFPQDCAAREGAAAGDRSGSVAGQIADGEDLGWKALCDAIDMPILLLDETHRVLRANRAARERGEIAEGERRHLCCDGAPESRGSAQGCPLCEALSAGKPVLRECRGSFGGSEARHAVWSFPLNTRSGPARAVVQVYRDITHEAGLHERCSDPDPFSAVGKLAAGVAHEIRNPLAAMMNAVSLLRSNARDGSEERELIEIVLEESRRVNRIVGDFLSFTRPSTAERSRVRIGELVASTVALVEKDPRFTGNVTLLVETDDSTIVADRDRIRQVIWNLLLNAVQAISGVGTVSIGASAEERGGVDGVSVRVDDSGQGVPEAMRERVFEPFQTSKPNGTGLGLSLARHIVEAHGGRIVIEDSRLGGAGVGFWLPADRKRE